MATKTAPKPAATSREALVEKKRNLEEYLKIFVAFAVPLAYLTVEVRHYMVCGKHEFDETCDYFSPRVESILQWCDCLCKAGLSVALVGFLHDTYLCAREGRFFSHLFHTFMGGEEELEDGKEYKMTISNTAGPVLFIASFFMLVGNTLYAPATPVIVQRLSFILDTLCSALVLTALMSVVFEGLIAFFHFDCTIMENFFQSMLACDRELEEYIAYSFDDNEFEEANVDEQMHKKVVQKPIGAWIQVILQWLVFGAVISVFWFNELYFRNKRLDTGLDMIGSVCTAGLVGVILSDMKSFADHLLNFRIGSLMSSTKSSPVKSRPTKQVV